MPEINVNGTAFEVDEDGFLVNLSDWTEEMAVFLAKEEGVEELSEDHWKLINYLRGYFKDYGIAPMVRKMTKESGYSLKESGPAKGACKVAGLPKPTGCV